MSHIQVCLLFLSGLFGIVCVNLSGELLSEVRTVDSVDCMPFSLQLLCTIVVELLPNCFTEPVREEIDCKILSIPS